jgi:hypothetical protein
VPKAGFHPSQKEESRIVQADLGFERLPGLDIDLATSRAQSMNSSISGLCVRFFTVMIPAASRQPIGSQAGSQAIIDARVLTAALLRADPLEAFKRYDRERRPIMNDITLRNRRFGPEAALQLVEERAPNGFPELTT